jgi:hypothetical protein
MRATREPGFAIAGATDSGSRPRRLRAHCRFASSARNRCGRRPVRCGTRVAQVAAGVQSNGLQHLGRFRGQGGIPMKRTFTTTSTLLGLLTAAITTGCGSSDPVAKSGDATGSDSQAWISAVGPATVSGCGFSQTFAVNSPQVIDWIANNFNNLSNVQMQLYNVNSANQASQINQNATSASQNLCSSINNATQSLASTQNASNAFNTAAAQNAQTTSRSLNQAADTITSVNGYNHVDDSASQFAHGDQSAVASQFANGAQSARSFGNNLANSAASNNTAAYNNGATAAQNASNAAAYNNNATAAQNTNNAAINNNNLTNANNLAFQDLASTGLGGIGATCVGGGALCTFGGGLGGVVSNTVAGNNVNALNSNNAAQSVNNATAAQNVNNAGQSANNVTAAQTANNSGAASNNAAFAQQAYNNGTDAFTNTASGSQAASSNNTSSATTAAHNAIINNTTATSQRSALNDIASTVGSTAASNASGVSNLASTQNAASSFANQNTFTATAANTLAYNNLSQFNSQNMLLQVTGQVTGANSNMQLFTGTGPSVLGSAAVPIVAPACAF